MQLAVLVLRPEAEPVGRLPEQAEAIVLVLLVTRHPLLAGTRALLAPDVGVEAVPILAHIGETRGKFFAEWQIGCAQDFSPIVVAGRRFDVTIEPVEVRPLRVDQNRAAGRCLPDESRLGTSEHFDAGDVEESARDTHFLALRGAVEEHGHADLLARPASRRIADAANIRLNVGAVLKELQCRNGILQVDDVFDLVLGDEVVRQDFDRDSRRRLRIDAALGRDDDFLQLALTPRRAGAHCGNHAHERSHYRGT